MRAGDPGFVGWATAIAYLVTALLAWRAAGAAGRNRREDERRLWLFLCAALLFLGFNKQLDLQTLLTDAGRQLARSEGWYRRRRIFQGLFQLVLMIAAAGGLALILRRFRHSQPAVKAAIAGLVFTITYVLTRAASFHHIDKLFGLHLGTMRLGWVVELAGIAVMGCAALAAVPKRGGR